MDGVFHPVPDVLAYLGGRWRVRRTVRDLGTGQTGEFDGSCEFRGQGLGGALLHTEEGHFTWAGVTRPAYRGHRFEPVGDGTSEVRFTDGRPFHHLDLRTGRWTAHHPCAADAYRGEFTVHGQDRWQVVWRVTGPHKDLLMITVHDRL
ncbi:DUF6314 family protein [Streptantibioticus rubrisoli]|uniref:DUF6314 family protein n=1 Tax=Streptantibioticus rubrisoli TaxID=1387313 RepID=UPI0035563BBC